MPATLPAPGAPDALYIVDLSSYVFRAYHALPPLSNTLGEPTHATYGTLSMLQKLIGERKPALLAVAMDSGRATFRMEIDPNYKATRSAAPADLSVQIERSRQIVEAYRIPIFQCAGVEADDLIATVVKAARAAHLFVVIVGADKDLMQLVGERVVMWDTMREKVYGNDEVVAKFGVPPEQMRDLLALMGDSSDNIPGVPSVGPKTASDLLLKFRTIDGIFANVGQVAKPKLRETLVANEANARMSAQLVTLRDDVPITFDLESLRYGGADLDTLREIYTELGFTRMIAAIPVIEPAPAKALAPARLQAITDAGELRALAGEAQRAGRLAIGVETTSADAMRAVVVGIALSVRAGEGWYVPVSHRYIGAPQQLPLSDVLAVLGPLLSDPSLPKIAHDLKYVDVVLERHGVPFRGGTFDSMIASYLLDPEAMHELVPLAKRELALELSTFDQTTSRSRTGQLAFDEVDLERATAHAAGAIEAVVRLGERLGPRLEKSGLSKLMDEVEIPLSRVLARMEQTGVLVDFVELARLQKSVDAELSSLERRCREVAGRDFNPNSPRQLEVVLFDELGLKSIKRTKTARSTDADVLEALAQQHPLPALVLEQRQLAKLKGTYIDALPTLVNPDTGRIHTRWSQAVAATGRISSNDPNLQNIPIRTDLGRAIRRAIVAPPGMTLLAADYSQIELRVLAHLSQDPVLIDAFQSGQDVHVRTAMEVFGVGKDDVTESMRRSAKTINFGVIYGMGEVALAKRLGIPRAEAAAFIGAYFKRYAGVRAFMDETLESARKGEAVRTILGRQRLLPDLRSSNGMLRAAAERIAQNTPIQGTAADLLKLAMIRLAEPPVKGARMLLTVHDELVFEVPEGDVAEAERVVKGAMESVWSLRVPLEVDVGHGLNWGDIA